MPEEPGRPPREPEGRLREPDRPPGERGEPPHDPEGPLRDAVKPPLAGRKVLVTRSPAQARSLSEAIRRAGGEPVEFPVIETLPPADRRPVDRALDRLASYDWLVFTSANAVRFFFDRLRERGPQFRMPSGVHVACVGTATARALERYGVGADLLPEEFLGESLVAALAGRLAPGSRVLFPSGNLARPTVVAGLRKAGIQVDPVVVYRTEVRKQGGAELARRLQSGEISAATLFSPSTVEGLVEVLEPHLPGGAWPGTVIACIGPVTAEAARKAGLPVHVVPEDSTVEGLVAALENYFRQRPER